MCKYTYIHVYTNIYIYIHHIYVMYMHISVDYVLKAWESLSWKFLFTVDLMHSSGIREGKTPTFNCTQCAFRYSTEYWLAIWGLSYSQACQMMPWCFLLPLTSTWTPCSLVVIGGLSPPTSFGTYGATLLCSFIINVVHGILVLFLLSFYVGCWNRRMKAVLFIEIIDNIY